MKINDLLFEDENYQKEQIKAAKHLINISNQIKKHDNGYIKKFLDNNVYFNHHDRSAAGKGDLNVKIVKNKSGRKPTDTPVHIHELFDKALEEKFGEKMRSNAMFVRPRDIKDAEIPFFTTSTNYIVIPLGETTMVTSATIDDFYYYASDIMSRFLHSSTFEKEFYKFMKSRDYSDEEIKKIREEVVGALNNEFIDDFFDRSHLNLFKVIRYNPFIVEFLYPALNEYIKNNMDDLLKQYYKVDNLSKLNSTDNEIMIHANEFLMIPLYGIYKPLEILTDNTEYMMEDIFKLLLNPYDYIPEEVKKAL